MGELASRRRRWQRALLASHEELTSALPSLGVAAGYMLHSREELGSYW